MPAASALAGSRSGISANARACSCAAMDSSSSRRASGTVGTITVVSPFSGAIALRRISSARKMAWREMVRSDVIVSIAATAAKRASLSSGSTTCGACTSLAQPSAAQARLIVIAAGDQPWRAIRISRTRAADRLRPLSDR